MQEPQMVHLSNGVPMYGLPGPTQGLLKLEVIFLVGRVHERQALTARAACRLMREGTLSNTGGEIAEISDFFGGSISSSDSMDHNGLVLQCLSHFFHDLLPVFSEMLLQPSFPEKELQSFIRNNQQRLSEDLSKNEIIAYRELTSLIFGADHPYGYNSTLESYAALTRDAVFGFWEDHYRAGNVVIFLSGQYDDKVIQAIDDLICKPMRLGQSRTNFPKPEPVSRRILHIRERESLQNAIRIGRLLFDRSHPDYYDLHAVSLLLGGYFGSRLMTQIREELGLTYNIYSHIDAMRLSGYFYISAEVSKEETTRTLEEIYLEITKLRTEPMQAEELLMMQRFAVGNMLHLLDGPFSQSDTLKNLIVEGGDFNDFNNMVQAIRSITPQKVMDLAHHWLDPNEMIEVVVG